MKKLYLIHYFYTFKSSNTIIINSPKISIILPFYNAEGTIERAISSIAKQTFENFECILIDNNSTDISRKIAEEWAKIDKRFIIISEARQGVMFASNAGSARAKGQYITRMDADDWAYPKSLEKKSKFLDNNSEYGAVAGLVEHISHSKNTDGFARYVKFINSIQTYKEIKNRQFIESPIVNPSAMWRKEVAEEHGMYRHGNFPEDYEMWLRWLSKGVKITKIPEVVLKWYDSDTRLTRTHHIYSDKAFYSIKTQYLAQWLKNHNPFYPYVTIWGASRISRRRARLLEQYGIKINSYIDIKKSRQLNKEVIYYQDIPLPNEIFILTYIKNINAREEIVDFLISKGYLEAKNFLLVS